MRKRVQHLLVVGLVALAVPFQGTAAVIAAQCMAFGHHQDGAADHPADGHAHDGAGGHDHAKNSHADAGKSKPGEDAKKPHCGPCTACCASASMVAPAAGLAIPAAPSVAIYVFSQLPPPAFEPDGLDRPPLAL